MIFFVMNRGDGVFGFFCTDVLMYFVLKNFSMDCVNMNGEVVYKLLF